MIISDIILEKIGQYYFVEGTAQQALQTISTIESKREKNVNIIYSVTDGDDAFIKSMFEYFKTKGLINKSLVISAESLENKNGVVVHKNYTQLEKYSESNLKLLEKYFYKEKIENIETNSNTKYQATIPLMNINRNDIDIVKYNIYIEHLNEDNVVKLSGSLIENLPCVIKNYYVADERSNNFIDLVNSLSIYPKRKTILLGNNIAIDLCKILNIKYEIPDSEIIDNLINEKLNTDLKRELDRVIDNKQPSEDFTHCVQNGVIPIVRQGVNATYIEKMSASVIIHSKDNQHSLNMLFQSFEKMNMKNIDVQFIIVNCKEDNITITKIIDSYKDKLKIKLYNYNIESIKEQFEKENEGAIFEEFSYTTNNILKDIESDIVCFCDSNNIVNEDWLISLCSPHYIYTNRDLVIKSRGGDLESSSTIFLQNKKFAKEFFNLPHRNNEYQAGLGSGWSIKTKLVKSIGGFDVKLSAEGSQADELIFRVVMKEGAFIGNTNGYSLHRKTVDGGDSDYFYKLLKKKHLNGNPPSIYVRNFSEINYVSKYEN